MPELVLITVVMILLVIGSTGTALADDGAERQAPKVLEAAPMGKTQPDLAHAYYTRPTGKEMAGQDILSEDGGKTWHSFKPTPDYKAGLPYGYRREAMPGVVDPATGRVVTIVAAMDTPGLAPDTIEPPEALKTYYLRYAVSDDAGRSYQFNEPIVVEGRTPENPVEGVYVNKNALMMGDIGSEPKFLRSGELLVPSQVTVLDQDGNLANPGGSWSYFEVVILRGTWREDGRLAWRATRVAADPHVTTRGLIEPTMAQMPDGRVLLVMRGSNERLTDPNFQLPSYKWMSVSCDGGQSWSKPEPWTYGDGEHFFSPSSMSQLVTHSSGRVFWIGNITPENARGNNPRWPLVMGEVDPTSLKLIQSSLVTIETRRPDETEPINLSHWRAFEDRVTGDILAIVPRYNKDYTQVTWTRYRLGVDSFQR